MVILPYSTSSFARLASQDTMSFSFSCISRSKVSASSSHNISLDDIACVAQEIRSSTSFGFGKLIVLLRSSGRYSDLSPKSSSSKQDLHVTTFTSATTSSHANSLFRHLGHTRVAQNFRPGSRSLKANFDAINPFDHSASMVGTDSKKTDERIQAKQAIACLI